MNAHKTDHPDYEHLYEVARRRGEHSLSQLYDEPDPMIDGDDIAQEAIIGLWGHVEKHGSESVLKPRSWISMVAFRRALKKQRIGFHDENRKASKHLDSAVEGFIAEHHRFPSQHERADMARQIVSEMREVFPLSPPQDEFDQLQHTTFLSDDDMTDEDLSLLPVTPGPEDNVAFSGAVESFIDRAMRLADEHPHAQMARWVRHTLQWLDQGYTLDEIGEQRSISRPIVAKAFGISRRSEKVDPALNEVRSCIRQAASCTLVRDQ